MINFNQETDLLSLHYDHAPDRDDGYATVAGKVLVDTYGVNHAVVGGAHGKNGDRYNPASESVMDVTWGTDGWINADDNRELAVQELGETWLTTIQNGGRVFVAEGGQADTSLGAAEYVRDNGGDPSKIKIVQHSNWNIDQYSDGVLDALVDLGVEHVKIDDGNFSNNTADLKETDSSVSNFVNTALNSKWSNAWEAAFDYLSPTKKLDFSDTVEALHILGVSLDEVADTNDFANFFLDEAPSNIAPVATSDSVSTKQGSSLTFSVLSNDSDPEEDALSIDSFDDSQTEGLVTNNGDGTFSYDPNGQFSVLSSGETETDTFTYTVSDGNGNTDTATVTMTIEGAANNEPTDQVITAVNAGGPALTQDGIDFVADTSFLNGSSFTNNGGGNGAQPDFDDTVYETERYGTPLNYEIPVASSGNYTVELYFAEIFWNNPGERVFDVAVEGEVVLDNLDLLAKTEGDINQPFQFNVPNSISPKNFGSADAIDIDFSASTDNAKISGIVVRSADESSSNSPASNNSEPVATSDSVSTKQGSPLTFSVLSNDSDPEEDALSIDSFDDSQTEGLVTNNGDGTFSYDPNGQFSVLSSGETETDTFTYTVSDGNGNTDTATVTMTIEGAANNEPTDQVITAVNAGGPALTQDGIDFVADTSFLNGSSFTNNGGGNGAQPDFDDTVYETERYGTPLNYEIPVASSGNYTVELYFAEIFWNNPGERVFDVAVEGEVVLDNLDLLAKTEGDINQPFQFNVPNSISPKNFGSADAIDIDFSASTDNAKISGIVVRSADESSSNSPASNNSEPVAVNDGITGALEIGLYDAETDNLIQTIQDGDTVDENNLVNQNLTMAASVSDRSLFPGEVESMVVNLNNGQEIRTENVEPYALFGDTNGDFFNGSGIPEGDNTISFELYSQQGANGDLLDTVTMNFEIL